MIRARWIRSDTCEAVARTSMLYQIRMPLGIATAATIRTTAITTTNSTRLKPLDLCRLTLIFKEDSMQFSPDIGLTRHSRAPWPCSSKLALHQARHLSGRSLPLAFRRCYNLPDELTSSG